ncbi:MAG: phosphoribosyltransferase [Candidatus Nezhaarchaeota archaeon]|nr:phosphoribosyltransferase [Candidatus Nezhaarchaeota archaeon]
MEYFMLYPVKFVEWNEVVKWTQDLSKKVAESDFNPDVVVAVGRGGFVVARLLCDFLDVGSLMGVPVKWLETDNKNPAEKYLADMIRGWVKASRGAGSVEKSIEEVVKRLRVTVNFEYDIDLRGLKALLVEEIIVTGFHMKKAKEVVEKRWKAPEVKTATLTWKSTMSALKPDYFVVEITEFVWFQFPWSRLDDYRQFLRVMLQEESRENAKNVWTLKEVEASFKKWYGAEPDPIYLEKALEILDREGLLKMVSKDSYEVTCT